MRSQKPHTFLERKSKMSMTGLLTITAESVKLCIKKSFCPIMLRRILKNALFCGTPWKSPKQEKTVRRQGILTQLCLLKYLAPSKLIWYGISVINVLFQRVCASILQFTIRGTVIRTSIFY